MQAVNNNTGGYLNYYPQYPPGTKTIIENPPSITDYSKYLIGKRK